MTTNRQLYVQDGADQFWRLLDPAPQQIWDEAIEHARSVLPESFNQSSSLDVDDLYAAILSESVFGEDRYRLNRRKTIYYNYARPLLPNWSRHLIRRLRQPTVTQSHDLLDWPCEDRYVRFQFAVLDEVSRLMGWETLNFVGLWPHGKRFSFVITHDVEAKAGYEFVRDLAAMEMEYGFRSSFNFVPHAYTVEETLLDDLRSRGFEIGVHGLIHDGRLFSSQTLFQERATSINQFLHRWDAVGFRSPMTHRNPQWLQRLDIEYDLSFFDTDPFEPMAGGVMSVWPFQIGRFIELPYTLMQDHTYLRVFGYTAPDQWLKKVEFLRANAGMALINVHPDYLLEPTYLSVYERFLAAMSDYVDCWHALPREVSRWWQQRHSIEPKHCTEAELTMELPAATVWTWHTKTQEWTV